MSHLSRRTLLAGAAGLIAAGIVPSRNTMGATTFERDKFIGDVKKALALGQEAVHDIIARAISNPSAVIRELGEPKQGSIQLLHRESNLSIFNIVWPPHTVLVPHDHLMWASIGVYTGREDNMMWRRAGGTIEATNAASVAAKEAFSLPADAIHSVVNPVQRYTAAIHVYGGDLTAARRTQWDALTLAEQPFDTEEGRRILEQADRRASDL